MVLAVGTAVVVLLSNRQKLLKAAVQRVTDRTEARYPVRLLIGPARFTSLTSVAVEGVRLVPTAPGLDEDTLLRVGRVTATISLKSIFRLRPIFANLTLDDLTVSAHKRDSVTNNYSFLLRREKPTAAELADSVQAARGASQWGTLLNGVLEAGFGNLPEEATFRRVTVTYRSPRHRVLVRMPRFRVGDGRFRTRVVAEVDSIRNAVRLNGTLDADEYKVSLIAYPAEPGGRLVAPYLPPKYHARLGLDTLRLLLDGKDYDGGSKRCTVRGFARFQGLRIQQPRLAKHEIGFPNTAARFVATLGPDYAALDPGTAVQMGRVVATPTLTYYGPRLPPGVKAGEVKPGRRRHQVTLKVRTNELAANDVLTSLPTGMFDELEGMQAVGTLRYSLDFGLDLARLDSLRFDSNLIGKGFRVTQFGATDLSKLAREFPYTAYTDKGDSVKTFQVGPSNPEFVAYDQVSPFLVHAILTAEDPRFFTHKGFMETAFRRSLIQNIRERRFARGGSTLSMQLVKNVFLTRQKTIARKIEEVLIVWIIEHNQPRFVSKERMMEVYLNVIEWGPRKYGVTEAARFFFAKRPDQLNLNEALYLASIIPSPSRFRQSFDSYGNLRGKGRYFFKVISGLMLQRGYITQAEYQALWPGVTLAGAARALIVTARDTTSDTLEIAPILPPDFIGPTFEPPTRLPMGAKRDDASDVLE